MSDVFTLKRLATQFEAEWLRARRRSKWWTSLARRAVNDRVSDFAYNEYTAIKRKYEAALAKAGAE